MKNGRLLFLGRCVSCVSSARLAFFKSHAQLAPHLRTNRFFLELLCALKMAPFEHSYDAVLEIRLYRQSSFDTSGPGGNLQEHVISAASNTEKRLLVMLSRTDAWIQLYAESSRSFDTVQTLLSEIYVLAQSKLGEDAGVDVVIDVLRGESGKLASASARKLVYSDEGEGELSRQAGASAETGAFTTSNEQDGVDSHKSPAYLGTVALGGTFDHLHPGHQILLTMACWLAKRRTIVGITGELVHAFGE